METAGHIMAGCKDPQLKALKAKLHKKIAEQVAEAIKDKQMAEWVAKALPPLWGSSDVDLEEIKYVQVRDAMKNMKNWNPGDLWKGAAPSAVVELATSEVFHGENSLFHSYLCLYRA